MSALFIDPVINKEALIGLLYALNDSGYWSARQFSDWATEVLMSSNDPSVWTLDLILVKDREGVDHAFEKICSENNIFLPHWVYDLTAGFIALRHAKGLIGHDTAIKELGERADAYGVCGLSPEEVNSDFNLDDVRLEDARSNALTLFSEIEKRPISQSILAAAL